LFEDVDTSQGRWISEFARHLPANTPPDKKSKKMCAMTSYTELDEQRGSGHSADNYYKRMVFSFL